jgi:glutamate carboxypeptidase
VSVLDRALAALAARRDDTVRLLERLVLVNSHSLHVSGVNHVGNLLIEALAPLPLALTVTTSEHGIRHLDFATPAAEMGPSVLLIGHHDTVFPPGEFEGFVVDGDLARGPGVLDMKGGLALIVQTLHALHEVGALTALPLRLVSVGDEEIGSPTSRALLEELVPTTRAALVFEAGRAGDAIITARRGAGHALVEAHGRAAHAGNALAEGRSAIWALARYVDRVQSTQGAVADTSASVGLVRGGTARNTVPDHAAAEIDLRFGDAAGQAALCELLRQHAREIEASLEGTRLSAQVEVTRPPWTRSDASAALAARYGEAQREAGLDASEAPRMGGGSDANIVGALGVPAIDGLGPRGAGFHTRGEHVLLSSLPKKAEALLRFLLREPNFGAEG